VKVEIVGDNLVVTAPISKALSSSGKSFLLVTSSGNITTDCTFEGQKVVVGLNAYVPNPNYVAPVKAKK
jgi:hypothetical protein